MISIIAIYVLPMMFVVFFAAYTKHQLVDEDDGPGWTRSETWWHRFGLWMRLSVALMGAAWVFLPAPDPVYFFHAAAICAAVFDIAMNLFRGKPLLYYGAGGSDAKLKNLKWVIIFGNVLVTTIFVGIN